MFGAAVGGGLALLTSAAAACSADELRVFQDGAVTMRFSVEVVDTDESRARGLMFRESLPTASGMLFVYDQPGPRAFWMRNTLIPLDIIFADPSGTVVRVAADAVPLDETPIPGPESTQYILEINGGLADRLGITEGAVFQHPAIDGPDAAQPCD